MVFLVLPRIAQSHIKAFILIGLYFHKVGFTLENNPVYISKQKDRKHAFIMESNRKTYC